MSDFADLFRAKGHGLMLPRDDEDAINRYVAMHSGERQSVERRPFPRQVDFWAFSIATALALKLEPREGPTGAVGKELHLHIARDHGQRSLFAARRNRSRQARSR